MPSTSPAGMLNAGLARHVERRGERGREDHQVDLFARDLAEQQALGHVARWSPWSA